jgi:hypothetical protein
VHSVADFVVFEAVDPRWVPFEVSYEKLCKGRLDCVAQPEHVIDLRVESADELFYLTVNEFVQPPARQHKSIAVNLYADLVVSLVRVSFKDR